LTDSFDTGLVTRKGQCYILPYSSFVGFALSSENPDCQIWGPTSWVWRQHGEMQRLDRDIISWIESLVFSLYRDYAANVSVFMPDIINGLPGLSGKRVNVSSAPRVCN
jgi:hypothetical protein